MKRIILLLLALFISIFVQKDAPKAAKAAAADAKIVISCAAPGNNFTQGEAISFTLNVKPLRAATRKTYTLSHTVIRLETNSTVSTGKKSVTMPYTGTVAIPAPSYNGLYSLKVTVVNSATGATSTAAVPFSQVIKRSGLPVQNDIFGVCTHFGHSWTGSDYGNKSSVMAKAGTGWIRDELYWARAETVKGTVTVLPEWDAFINSAISAGLKPLLILDYYNPLYDNGGPPYTDKGLAGFANYVKTIVTHFKGKVSYYEVWNEYNLVGTIFNPTRRTAEDYVKMLKITYQTIKAIDPNITVIGCSMSGYDETWLKAALKAGAINYMDAVSFHPYCQPRSPEDGSFTEKITACRKLLGQYGRSLPVWITEIGWPTAGANSVSEKVAGDNLIRTYVLGIASGVSKIFWYDFQDDGISTSNPEYNFGLTKNWNSPVPLAAKDHYLAYSTVTSILTGAVYIGSGSSGTTQLFRFRDPGTGDSILVAWARSGPAKVTLNVTAGSTALIYNKYGNAGAVTANGGKVSVSLSTSPVFVRCRER